MWSAHDVVVTSIDYVKTRTEQVLAHGWDVIVVDEAHLCARPHTLPGAPEPDMARWQFAAQAARAGRHLLLLTATPHNGYSDSYASLFQMLAPTLVEHAAAGPRIRRDHAHHHVVQRTRRDIEAWYERRGLRSPFPTRDADEHIIDLTGHPEVRAVFDRHLTVAAEKPTAKRALPTGTKVLAIHGGLTLAERRVLFAELERAERAVLVATDCISEGLNLQHACAEVIHYELPWNPNRLEQRNGRIDRFHQREQLVGVRTLVYDDLLDLAILELIVKKSKQMLDEYGFVPPFLANPDILAHLTATASRHRLAPTLFEADQLLDETLAPADLLDHDRLERIRAESFYGQEEVTLGTVAEALEASRREVGSPQVVEEFFRASVATLPGVTLVDLPGGLRLDGTHPDIADVHPGARLLSFDPEAGFADPDVDVVDLAHPLLRRLVDLALDAARRPECSGRVAARLSPGVDEVTGVVWLLVRYLARADPPVLLEELVPMACPVWGAGPTPADTTLLDGPHRDPPKDADEVSEAAAALLARPDLPARIDRVAGERARLVAERHRELEASWAAGLAEVEVMSRDPVAVTIVYPAARP